MNVVLLIYNRPTLTARVAQRILAAEPCRLFVIADGPKNATDRDQCEATRAVVERLNWKCGVTKNYAETNLGCRQRVTGGLDWVFSQVEDAIILEDDCVPDPTFFPFCQEMLDHFREDSRVGHISGDNFLEGRCRTHYSYYFSRYSSSWGWATWRRAWAEFDADIRLWPELAAGKWHYDMFPSRKEAAFYEAVWDSVCEGNTHIWDAQWLFSRLIHSSLSVIPVLNLVTNIGCGPEGTYTKDVSSPAAAMAAERMVFPVKHPPFMICDLEADRHLADEFLVRRDNPMRYLAKRLRNKYFYGAMIRKLPVIGDLWVKLRRHTHRISESQSK